MKNVIVINNNNDNNVDSKDNNNNNNNKNKSNDNYSNNKVDENDNCNKDNNDDAEEMSDWIKEINGIAGRVWVNVATLRLGASWQVDVESGRWLVTSRSSLLEVSHQLATVELWQWTVIDVSTFNSNQLSYFLKNMVLHLLAVYGAVWNRFGRQIASWRRFPVCSLKSKVGTWWLPMLEMKFNCFIHLLAFFVAQF